MPDEADKLVRPYWAMRTSVLSLLARLVGALPLAALALTLAREAHGAPAPPPPAAAAPEPVNEQAELEKGRNAYRAKSYDEADQRFLQMLDPQHGTLHDKVLIKQARMYWAATLIALHHNDDASHVFEIILNEDHEYEPDPLAFPTEVLDRFTDTRVRLREKLLADEREQFQKAAERRAREEERKQEEAARVKMLEKLAGEAYVVEKHRRWVALLPFGVGQFQNGDRKLGWAFLGTEAALLAGVVVTLPLYYVDLANVKDNYSSMSTNTTVAQEWNDRANSVRMANLALNGVFALAAVAGAIEAEIAFVPKTTDIVPRPVPDTAPTAPSGVSSMSFSVLPAVGRDGHGVAGGVLGLSARF
jgi:hypothetical protein